MYKLCVIQADLDAARNLVGDILGARYAASEANVASVARYLSQHRIASQAELLRVGRNLLALAEIKWGNLDESANAIFADARATLSHTKGEGE